MDNNLIKQANVDLIAKKGAVIYHKLKNQYEPKYNGQFLAIDTKSKDVFLAKSSAEAVELARSKYPDSVFYVVKIGYSAVEKLASLGIR